MRAANDGRSDEFWRTHSRVITVGQLTHWLSMRNKELVRRNGAANGAVLVEVSEPPATSPKGADREPYVSFQFFNSYFELTARMLSSVYRCAKMRHLPCSRAPCSMRVVSVGEAGQSRRVLERRLDVLAFSWRHIYGREDFCGYPWVANMRASVGFHKDVLGLEIIYGSEGSYFTCSAQKTVLQF